MATFNIHQDQENSSVLPNKLKENGMPQKRTVLRALNQNPDQNGDSKLPPYKDVGPKKTAAVKGAEENEKQYPNCKIINPKQKTKTGACKDKYIIKDENKSRVLKDKLLDHEKPSSSKEIDIPACITTLHREPAISTIYSVPSIDDVDDIIQDSPMSVDTSKTDSNFKVEKIQSKDEPSLNERLFACQEYKTEIFLYLRSLQHEHRPRKNYMLKQSDISYSMRAILVDWLVEVVEEYRLKTETLYLAVSYIDRFLSYMSVVRAKLQLVGTAAMFIASKFEEIYPPDVKDFVFVTDDTYSKKQVLRMENLILKVLSFDVSTPTTLYFLTYYLSNYTTTDRVKYLAMYLCELTLLEADPFLEFLPSVTAASALLVARYTLSEEIGEEVFPEKLQEAMDHHIEDLITCIAAIDKMYKKSPNNPQRAINEKYKSEMYRSVSSITPLSEDCSSVLRKKYMS
ncbi:UNVERIFIED_CONTAM: hypothetical protein PYX00_005976 [Menopon gallinae]|uniref:Cyclin A n=1 Tax=Menopon gallinae TaxID=328185 RepID=A0AAW2HTS3_9NEOP